MLRTAPNTELLTTVADSAPPAPPPLPAVSRRAWTWGLVAAFLALLLSVFSAGFFLYSVLTAAGLLILAVTLASSSLSKVELRRSLAATEIELGAAIDGSLILANQKSWPAWWLFWRERVSPGLDVEGPTARYTTVPAAGEVSLQYRLHSTRRGIFRVGPAVVETSGPFGLARRFKVDSEPAFLTVMPHALPIGRGWPLGHRPIHQIPRRRGLFEDPARFQGVRAYRPGDSRRRVHWRATARSGELQIKVFEPAVLDGALLAVEMGIAAYPDLDPADELPNPQLELTVTTVASLAEFVLAGDQKVGLLANGGDAAESFAGDWQGGTFRRLERALEIGDKRSSKWAAPVEVEPGSGAWQRQRLRLALARLEPTSGMTLPQLLSAEMPRLPRSLVLMVVTPRLDRELGAALEGLRQSGFELAVVWIAGSAEAAAARPPASLPLGVPLYPVASEDDLERLGSQAL